MPWTPGFRLPRLKTCSIQCCLSIFSLWRARWYEIQVSLRKCGEARPVRQPIPPKHPSGRECCAHTKDGSAMRDATPWSRKYPLACLLIGLIGAGSAWCGCARNTPAVSTHRELLRELEADP